MNKSLNLVVALFVLGIVFTSNLWADCNPPDGITTDPPWIEGAEPETFFLDASNICTGGTYCEVTIHWCYREIDGTCEILIGEIEMKNIVGPDEDYKINFCWERWEQIKELLIDRAVFNIAFDKAPCLYDHNIKDCDEDPTNDPWVLRVIEASCKTEPQLKMDYNGTLTEVIYPCDGSSFCKYRYQYCREYDENGNLVGIYSKELMMNTTTECEPLLHSNRYISCFPEDCHLDRFRIYEPTNDQIATAPNSDTYYLSHQAGL